ncbi:unnamed protein product, partial [Scytosiphon promiscuus]
GSSSRAGPAGGRGRLPRAPAAAAATPRSGAGTDDFALNSSQAQTRTRKASKKAYYPQKPTTGSASLLVQLLLFEQRGVPNPEKKTLQAAAQRFCEEPMEAPTGPHNTAHTRYGAWAAMKGTLEKKGLVLRNTNGGRNHTFSLQPDGREIASRLLRENLALYTGGDGGGGGGGGSGGGGGNGASPNPFSPPRRGGGSGSGSGSGGGGGGGSSSSPNPFSPPRRSGGTTGNSTKKSNFSPVRNPYASSIGVSTAPSGNGGGVGGSGGGGGGRSHGAKNPAGVAAEARRSKELASKTAALAAAATTASLGTSRGRALQERGKEKHAKRAKLYEATSPGSQCYHRGLKPSSDAGSPLLSVLKQCGQAGKKLVRSGSAKPAAGSPPSSDGHGRDDGGGGSGAAGEEDLGMADEDWMALTSPPAKKRSAVISPSVPPPRNRRTSSNPPKSTRGAPKGEGAPAVVLPGASPAPGTAVASAAGAGGRR